MYDDSRADEATITVIATGLHNVGGSASKLKSRLENQKPASTVSHVNYERPVQTQTQQRAAASAAPQLDIGMIRSKGTAGTGSTVPRRSVGGTQAPTLDTPRTPTSKVKEQSIKIPDFFKK